VERLRFARSAAAAGVPMTAGVLTWLSAPLALFIGGVGAVSVIKAVYIDQRDFKRACVGGRPTYRLASCR